MTRAERALLLAAAKRIELPVGTALFMPGEPIRHVYLPEGGLVALLSDLPDAGPLAVGLIGREGLVGLPALLGDPVAGLRVVVQVEMPAHRIDVPTMLLLADGSRNLRMLVRQYSMTMLAQAGHSAACNALHPLEHRTARLLLSAADRIGPNIPITQEQLAAMLGVRRPTINLVLQQLRRSGLIRHARGQLAILDQAGLEAASCPCYRAIRQVHDRLFPKVFAPDAVPDARDSLKA